MAPISNSHQVLFLNSYHLLYLSYTAFLSSIVSRGQGGSLRPPLPSIVRQSLSRRRLAYLGTVDITTSSTTGGDGATESGGGGGGGVPYPHLSLMRFTYLPEEDAILMSTNVYTKKYDMLSAGAAGGVSGRGGGGGALVALLVHDFADSSHSSSTGDVKEVNGESGGMYSITLNGTCSVVKDGKHVLAKSAIILAAYWHCIGSLTSFSLPFLSISHIIIYNIIIIPVILAEKYRQIHLKNNPDYPQASTTS